MFTKARAAAAAAEEAEGLAIVVSESSPICCCGGLEICWENTSERFTTSRKCSVPRLSPITRKDPSASHVATSGLQSGHKEEEDFF